MLAVSESLVYTKLARIILTIILSFFQLQYKIPLQIENEDVVMFWLSLRQLAIMMAWWWLAYAIFRSVEAQFSPEVAFFIVSPILILGFGIAIFRISEMTFLPTVLNYLRLSLNSRLRMWSQGTDGFSDLDIGYSFANAKKADEKQNKSLDTVMQEQTEASDRILKL